MHPKSHYHTQDKVPPSPNNYCNKFVICEYQGNGGAPLGQALAYGGYSWTNLNLQDKTWAEYLTLDVGVLACAMAKIAFRLSFISFHAPRTIMVHYGLLWSIMLSTERLSPFHCLPKGRLLALPEILDYPQDIVNN
jgi:hypothetical protein